MRPELQTDGEFDEPGLLVDGHELGSLQERTREKTERNKKRKGKSKGGVSDDATNEWSGLLLGCQKCHNPTVHGLGHNQ